MNNTIKNLLGFAGFVGANVAMMTVIVRVQADAGYEANRPVVEYPTMAEAYRACMDEVHASQELTHCEFYKEALALNRGTPMDRAFFGHVHAYPEISHWTATGPDPQGIVPLEGGRYYFPANR